MNRFMVGMAFALLLAGVDGVHGQTTARVEVRSGRIGVAVSVGNLPIRVRPQGTAVAGWIAADWGPVRWWMGTARPVFRREVLRKNDLRNLLGKEGVRRLEQHARVMGLNGPIRGRWYALDRFSAVLEVEVRGVTVAELYDYGRDGFIDRVLLTQPLRTARYKEPPAVYRRGGPYRYPGGSLPW